MLVIEDIFGITERKKMKDWRRASGEGQSKLWGLSKVWCRIRYGRWVKGSMSKVVGIDNNWRMVTYGV